MVTFAQAQERAERWVNGDVPAYQHREVRVREFDLGFVVWAEDREDGPTSDGGRARLVIARDSGETTLWPALPVGEVIRRYEEEYGAVDESVPEAEGPPKRLDLEATSFLLSPPQWLQDAADAIGIPDRRSGSTGAAAPGASGAPGAPGEPAAAPEGEPEPLVAASWPDADASPAPSAEPMGETPWPGTEVSDGSDGPVGATPWAGADTNTGEGDGDRSVGLPATVLAPALSGTDEDDAPAPGVRPDAKTALMATGSALPPTAIAPAIEDPSGRPPYAPGARGEGDANVPGGQGLRPGVGASVPPGPAGAPGAGGSNVPGGPGAGGPVPPGAPGVPGMGGSGVPGAPGAGG
ncbi:hypothetical protein J7E86_24670, partial [Streptomyces sp. ISL-11]|nr:hypothetical protein [Streptomyces sp. ISL-11]